MEIYGDPIYRDIEGGILSAKIEENIEVDNSWDSLEAKALENLGKVMAVNKDPELNLKVASVANRAVRRTRANNAVLDATRGEGTRATIKLTQRMMQKLGKIDDSREVEMEVEASIGLSNEDIESMFSGESGRMSLPNFGDSDE
jgi:hypothetical protein